MSGRIVHPNASEAVATSYSGGYEPFGDEIAISVAVTDVGSSGTLAVSVEWFENATDDALAMTQRSPQSLRGIAYIRCVLPRQFLGVETTQ